MKTWLKVKTCKNTFVGNHFVLLLLLIHNIRSQSILNIRLNKVSMKIKVYFNILGPIPYFINHWRDVIDLVYTCFFRRDCHMKVICPSNRISITAMEHLCLTRYISWIFQKTFPVQKLPNYQAQVLKRNVTPSISFMLGLGTTRNPL